MASNVFSFFIKGNSTEGSELCLGCVDSSKYTGGACGFVISNPGATSIDDYIPELSDIEWFNLNTTATNGVPVTYGIDSAGVTVNDHVVAPGFLTILDSGSTVVRESSSTIRLF